MSRNSAFRGPKLPSSILDQVQNGSGDGKGRRGEKSRKDRRKAERKEKKSGGWGGRPTPMRRRAPSTDQTHEHDDDEDLSSGNGDEVDEVPSRPAGQERKPHDKKAESKSLKSILKPSKKEPDTMKDRDDISESSVDEVTSSNISRGAALRGLQDDDDEIAALERRLGVKGKKKGGAVTQDELDFLVRGSDSEDDMGLDLEGNSKKRKRPEDSKWLLDKRRKAMGAVDESEDEDDEEDPTLEDDMEDVVGTDDGSEDEDHGLDNPFSEDDELSDDEFDGLDSENDEQRPPPGVKKQRENPYLPPVAKGAEPASGKYIPPSLRKPPASDEEALKLLRRQVQGQMNRLSEANMLSILQAIEALYKDNPRQYVTSTLVELLNNLVADPSTLSETFLILHAGFATALYRLIGTDFGAQLLERLVDTFDQHHTVTADADAQSNGKEALNTIAFIANLYTFQLTSSVLIFDYIRLLLCLSPESSLSESNTELLLRTIRISGPQLRQDDPSALKDIVLLLQRSVSQVGEANLSVRTKFMIESINDLKNNRVKAGAVGSSQVSAEHTTRMKKTLGSLNVRVKANEPLRISLADIKDSEKRGKWWLVGASWRENPAKEGSQATSESVKPLNDDIAADESVEKGTTQTDLLTLARSQGMNTDIRRAVFSTLLSASDFSDAYMSILKLRLNAKQELEIPRVLLHCAGAEETYNPYYTLVAKKLCHGSKRIAKAFRFAVLGVLRGMGESMHEGDDEYDDDEGVGPGKMNLKKVVNLAKLYGSLVADGGVPITTLKTLDFLSLQPKTKTFVEILLITLFLEASKRAASDPSAFEAKIQSILMAAAAVEQDLVQGLRFFLQTVVEKSDLVNGKKEKKTVRTGCKIGIEALVRAGEEGIGPVSGGSESESGDEFD